MSDPRRRLLAVRSRLWRQLRAAVEERVGPSSRELRLYERSHRSEFRQPGRPLALRQVLARAAQADLVYCGDYHTYRPAQGTCLRLMEAMARGGRLVLLVEFALSSHQRHLDAYLAGRIDQPELLRRLRYASTWGFGWQGYQELLEYARRNAIPVLGLNGPGTAEGVSIRQRDAWAGQAIAQAAAASPDARLLVLVGDLHLAADHLPRAVERAMAARGVSRRRLRVFQDCDELYARTSPDWDEVDAVELAGDGICVLSGTPWERLDSYLRWLEHGADGLPPEMMQTPGILDMADHVLELVTELSGFLRVEPPHGDIQVLSAADIVDSVVQPNPDAVHRQARAHDVYLFPDGESLYLRRFDLAHAAEGAATLLVRDALGGGPPADDDAAFPQHAWRRGLAFFGSKILAPAPRPAASADRVDRLVQHHAAAVLAELVAGRAGSGLVAAVRDDRLLDGRVAAAVGRGVGEELYGRLRAGQLSSEELTDLFRPRVDASPLQRMAHLMATSVQEGGGRRHLSVPAAR